MKIKLTDNDELDPDGVRPEPVDALAAEDAGVLEFGRFDLQNLLVHLVPNPGEVDRFAALEQKKIKVWEIVKKLYLTQPNLSISLAEN